MAGSGLVLFISAVILLVGCCYIRSYCRRKPPALQPDVYNNSRDFQFVRPYNTGSSCDSPRREHKKTAKEKTQETSFMRTTDTRYKSLHASGMQGRPLPEIPEYDVPKGVYRDEQETLLVRGKPNDEILPNDVIVPTSICLPSDRDVRTEEEMRRMQSMIRGHPNNMTLFSNGNPNSKKPKNPRHYASTMGRVLKDHPNMILQQPQLVQSQTSASDKSIPPQQFTRLPKQGPTLNPPDVVCIDRNRTVDSKREEESPMPIYSEEVQIHTVPQGHISQVQGQTQDPLDGAINSPTGNSILRTFGHHGVRQADRPLSV